TTPPPGRARDPGQGHGLPHPSGPGQPPARDQGDGRRHRGVLHPQPGQGRHGHAHHQSRPAARGGGGGGGGPRGGGGGGGAPGGGPRGGWGGRGPRGGGPPVNRGAGGGEGG